VIADGYYEWRDADKQPFAVALANRGPMTLAGLSRGFFCALVQGL